MRSYRDLQAWKRAMDLVERVYELTAEWPATERYGLTSQVRRSAVSVAANIAEGAGRKTTGEFMQFLGIARGSVAETETLLLLSLRLGLTRSEHVDPMLTDADAISRMLTGLSAALKRRQSASHSHPHSHQ